MRVLVAGSVSPFSGREEIHWTTSIAKALGTKGLDVDTFMLPFVGDPLLIPEQMMSLRLLDVESSCDLLLAVGYPAFVLRHRRKRVLLFSLASSLHEHFGTEYGIISTPQYQRIRAAVQAAEQKCLAEAEHIVCASRTLANQIQNQYGLWAQILIFADGDDEIGQEGLAGPQIRVVCESTLEPPDRIDLLLDAVTRAKGQWHLSVSVPAASEVYSQALNQRIERLGLNGRVRVPETALSTAELRQAHVYVALPFAATRIPDSLFRAIRSGIPVVTATDCGSVLEVVRNETNGLVVRPSAMEIARALDQLVADQKLHRRLSRGQNRTARGISGPEILLESLME